MYNNNELFMAHKIPANKIQLKIKYIVDKLQRQIWLFKIYCVFMLLNHMVLNIGNKCRPA